MQLVEDLVVPQEVEVADAPDHPLVVVREGEPTGRIAMAPERAVERHKPIADDVIGRIAVAA